MVFSRSSPSSCLAWLWHGHLKLPTRHDRASPRSSTRNGHQFRTRWWQRCSLNLCVMHVFAACLSFHICMYVHAVYLSIYTCNIQKAIFWKVFPGCKKYLTICRKINDLGKNCRLGHLPKMPKVTIYLFSAFPKNQMQSGRTRIATNASLLL